MKLTKRRIVKFQKKILEWWDVHKRDLPWRHTHDPYKIFVSEVMLQQTNVRRVIPKYKEFLGKFPSIKVLKNASISDVLRVWKGMGYNRRALYLKKVGAFGKIPETENDLMKLPGVGKYTARAILIFAYQKNIAAVDTNIRQIITHFFFHDVDQKPLIIQGVADHLLPAGRSWEWHQALMDYGALEMPKLKTRKVKRVNSIPFKETKRFYRGRVIDALREKDSSERLLLKKFAKKFNKPEDFLVQIVNGLITDGLVQRQKAVLRLPD